MDEEPKVEQNNIPEEKPQKAENPVVPTGSQRNLILAIVALVVGAIIISAIFVISLPNDTANNTETVSSQTTNVKDINKTSDLDTASKELDSVDLDGYVNELKQNDADTSGF